MPYHHDLLAVSRQMIDRNPGTPIKAELGRGVSTAYYALFHLLIHEATDRLVSEASIRPRVARTFDHRNMRAVCIEYQTKTANVVPAEIARIAADFVLLNDARTQADYDLSKAVTHVEAEAEVSRAEAAFADWQLLQNEVATSAFLAELWCRGMPKR